MPLRCLCGWLVYNALLIKANLFRREISEDPLYPLRGIEAEAEATGHVLWGCPATKDAWNICGSKIQ